MTVSRPKSSEEKLFSELAKIDNDVARRRFLARHPSLLRSQVVGQLAPMVVDKVRVDTRQALHLAEAAVLIARRLRRRKDLALALRAKGNALHLSGDNRAAVQHHEQALKLYESLGLWSEAARTLSTSIQPLNLLGEYDRAFTVSERAREIFTQLEERTRIATLDNNVGNIFHRQDRFEEAQTYYERAYNTLLADQEWERAGFALHNVAMCLINLNDFPRALDCFQTARDLYVRHRMPLLRDQADYNIAYLYYLRGDYSRAIEMLIATRRSCKLNGDAYHEALCHLDLSEIYLELNLSEEAKEMAREGFLRFKKLAMGYETAKALTNEAIAHGQQGQAAQALQRFAKARKLFAREGNLVWPRLLDLYQGLLLLGEGRHHDARSLCATAAEFFDNSVLAGKAALCHLLLAHIALKLGELPAAQSEAQKVVIKLSDIESPALAYQCHLLLGQIAEERRESTAAYSEYHQARKILESMRTRLQSEELKISFLKNRVQVYERLVDLHLRSQNSGASANEVFSYIEAAKSRSMIELVFQSGQSLPAGRSGQSELAQKIGHLRNELNWYYHRIELEQFRPDTSQGRLARLQQQAHVRENELLRAVREMPTHERETTMLETRLDFSVSDVQQALPADTVLIEYYSTGDRFVVSVVTRDTFVFLPVSALQRVTHLLHLLRFQFAKFRMGTHYTERFQEPFLRATLNHLEELYRELIAPLPIPPQARRLVFVPHGMLHFLPFHALRNRGQYLCDDYTISYAPSAALFAFCQQKDSGNDQRVLVLGVPDRRAPEILKEVQSVAALLPHAELFVGEQANSQLLRDRGAECGILHIGTHGVYRRDNPIFSCIKLGDGYLNLYDLYHMRLNAKLVTLSGCATGMNFVAAGDELLGLQRGLFCAGASSLLLSLWDVHDQSTAELMQSFYRGYGRSADGAASLREAMHQLRARYPHPYFWAPFVLSGKL